MNLSPTDCAGSLVRRLKIGDKSAWHDFITKTQKTLIHDICSSLRLCSLSEDLAEDIAQDTWAIAIRRAGDFVGEDDQQFYHWIRKISYNLIRNHSRKVRKQEYIENPLPEDFTDDQWLSFMTQDEQLHTVEDLIIRRSELKKTYSVLKNLTIRDREIFIRRFAWQQMPAEIAEDFPDLKARSVSQLLLRVRQKLEVMIRDT